MSKISRAFVELPAYKEREKVLQTIRDNQITLISGETGSGKSTVIPQLLLEADFFDEDRVILVTQPRRLAATSLAEYVAQQRRQETGEEVGDLFRVGAPRSIGRYHIRLSPCFGSSTRCIYMTTAVLNRHMQSEPSLDSVACLVVDEVHERDVFTDTLLMCLKMDLMKKRFKHLKVVLMSATLQAQDFIDYFSGVDGNPSVPLVKIEGRMFPVEAFYLEEALEWTGFAETRAKRANGKGKGKGKGKQKDVTELMSIRSRLGSKSSSFSDDVVSLLSEWKEGNIDVDLCVSLVVYLHQFGYEFWQDTLKKGKSKGSLGSILVFLPGWGDIEKVFLALKAHECESELHLLYLHSIMTPESQSLVFEPCPPGKRKVVLSTNVAETSVTIEDVLYVVDCAVQKERNFDKTGGFHSLISKPVSRTSVLQRRGRAGRCQEGVAFHLFPSYDQRSLPSKSTPSILTSSLEEQILHLKMMNSAAKKEDLELALCHCALADVQAEDVGIGIRILRSLGCLTGKDELTILGRAVGSIPIPPSLAKLVLISSCLRVAYPACIIAAILGTKSPFQKKLTRNKEEGSKGKGKGRAADDEAKRTFAAESLSDHQAFFRAFSAWKNHPGNRQTFSEDNGLSFEALCISDGLSSQLYKFLLRGGYPGSQELPPGSKEWETALNLSLACAMYPNLAVKSRGRWLSIDGRTCDIFPGSVAKGQRVDHNKWAVYSNSMSFNGSPEFMFDVSFVDTSAVLLFAPRLEIDFESGMVFFDNWSFSFQPALSEQLHSLLRLRQTAHEMFRQSLEERMLQKFPMGLIKEIVVFCRDFEVPLSDLRFEKYKGGWMRQSCLFWPKMGGGKTREELNIDDL